MSTRWFCERLSVLFPLPPGIRGPSLRCCSLSMPAPGRDGRGRQTSALDRSSVITTISCVMVCACSLSTAPLVLVASLASSTVQSMWRPVEAALTVKHSHCGCLKPCPMWMRLVKRLLPPNKQRGHQQILPPKFPASRLQPRPSDLSATGKTTAICINLLGWSHRQFESRLRHLRYQLAWRPSSLEIRCENRILSHQTPWRAMPAWTFAFDLTRC